MSSGPQKCPACDLLSPSGTQHCDCGYSFITGETSPSDAVLYVNLKAVKHNTLYEYYMCCLDISVWQGATLSINSKVDLVTTWTEGFVAGGPKDTIGVELRGQLNRSIDTLLNDYLSVNPRSR